MKIEGRGRFLFLAYLAAFGSVSVITLVFLLAGHQANPTTIALIYVTAVLMVARFFGSSASVLTAVAAAFCLNFFFLPPYFTLTIAEPQNWVSLFVFLVVSLTVGHLSARAKERAETAESLYTQLQDAFESASEAEAAKRSEKLASALLDAVTHDLRTPLTSIKAASTMLLDEQRKQSVHQTLDPERSADLLEVIGEEADKLNSFVESMVELATIESGEARWKMASVSPDQVITNAVSRASRLMSNHRLDIEVREPLPNIVAAPKAISEALYNLLDNAAKYSPKGSRVLLEVRRTEQVLRFSVEDEADLIPREQREAVFTKFYRRASITKGFGMGLAIVKGIVEAHNGTVWVEDGEKGNRFVFTIPVAGDGNE